MTGYRALQKQETHTEFAGGNYLKELSTEKMRRIWDNDKMDLQKIICRDGR
jgi:hypothetical protein